MNVNGKAYQNTNVRNQPVVVNGSNSNIVGRLINGNAFTGTTVTNASGETWIKLATVDGAPVTDDRYVASWVVNYQPADTTPPTEDDPIVGATVYYESGKQVDLVVK